MKVVVRENGRSVLRLDLMNNPLRLPSADGEEKRGLAMALSAAVAGLGPVVAHRDDTGQILGLALGDNAA